MPLQTITIEPDAISAPASARETNKKTRNRMTEFEDFARSCVPGKVRALPITKADTAAKDAPGDTGRGLKNSITRAFKRLKMDPAGFIIWEGIYAADAEKPDEKTPFLFVKNTAPVVAEDEPVNAPDEPEAGAGEPNADAVSAPEAEAETPAAEPEAEAPKRKK